MRRTILLVTLAAVVAACVQVGATPTAPPATTPAAPSVPSVAPVPTVASPTASPAPSVPATPEPSVPVTSDPSVPAATASPAFSIPPLPSFSIPPFPSFSIPPLPSFSIPPLPSVAPGAGLPCEQLTAAVTQAVGKELGFEQHAAGQCLWFFSDENGIPAAGGSVNARIEAVGGNALANVRTAFPGGADVPGLGQEAYWAPSVTVLWAFDGTNTYTVQLVVFPEGDDVQGIATRVMEVVLANA